MIQFLLERNVVPDFVIRTAIRRLLRQRLREENLGNRERQQQKLNSTLDEMRRSPVALHTMKANEQHYELPTDFFRLVLGKNLKYSSAYWAESTATLDDAEEAMLQLTCERADLKDGMDILELGCGWGSLSLYMASRFPSSKIIAVSNSRSQKAFIDEQCQLRGLSNLHVTTADMNEFQTEDTFDRVVSVEMFEHMRNYEELTKRISGWLRPHGHLFVHIFTHQHLAYPFEVKNDSDWMARYFFTGGLMPSDHLLFYFNNSLLVQKHWVVNGRHYGKTARAWLFNMDDHKSRILPILEKTYGRHQVTRWWVYWRIFFMACEELWSFDDGNEWFVSHYLLEKR